MQFYNRCNSKGSASSAYKSQIFSCRSIFKYFFPSRFQPRYAPAILSLLLTKPGAARPLPHPPPATSNLESSQLFCVSADSHSQMLIIFLHTVEYIFDCADSQSCACCVALIVTALYLIVLTKRS